MSKVSKIWLIIAIFLTLIGCIIFGGVMSVLNWDFTKLSTIKYETNNYEINENYKNVSIITDTADIKLVPSEDSKTSVVCYEQKNMKHTVLVEEDTLLIEINYTRKWYEYIGINIGSPKITVYVPKAEYGALSVKTDTGDVKIPNDFKFQSIDIKVSTGYVESLATASDIIRIKASTGDIKVENVSANGLDLSVSTGIVTVSNVTCENDIKIKVSTGKTNFVNSNCKNVISSGNTGDITLENVICKEKLSIKRSTGDVKLNGCDAGELFIKTDTGDVKGSLLSSKVFIVESDTGRIDVPKTMTGGKCEISTDTGSIKITVN